MLPGERRRLRNNGIAAGSVWENRIKLDEVKGGIKVFNDGETDADLEGVRLHGRLTGSQSDVINVEKRKRRNWKPPEPINLVQLRNSKLESFCYQSEEDDVEEIKEIDDKQIDSTVERVKFTEVEEKKKIHQVNEIESDLEIPNVEEKEPDQIVKIQRIEVESEMIDVGSETTKRMQSIVDLVMWRDVSKSAFIFGFGTFILFSSSYTRDLNFSFISAVSYLGLACMFLNFLYKSIIRRGNAESNEKGEKCIVGEEEAIFILRFFLPYINEVLINLKALFSGDPSITMKLAVLLLFTARYGSSITIWTLARLTFFGVFTIPKVLSSYSLQLARYGKFWLQRFRDRWKSCTHKKVVVAAIFAVIWNISSTMERIWALFMLVVAVKHYQQYAVEINTQEIEQENVTKQEDSKSALSPGKDVNRLKTAPPTEKWTQRNNKGKEMDLKVIMNAKMGPHEKKKKERYGGIMKEKEGSD